MDELFYELIRVAIGRASCLSRVPSEEEWHSLFEMANRQSLIGICFVGVQKLKKQDQGPTRLQYNRWLSISAKIQQKNVALNQQCSELQVRFDADGWRSCILKGQGIASFYEGSLRLLRQPGDIDVFLLKDGLSIKENKNAVLSLAKCIASNAKGAAHHVAVQWFPDTEVELHYEATYLCNPWANRRLQSWLKERLLESRGTVSVRGESFSFSTFSAEVNVVFLLAHAFRHYLSEGMGLRQVMDYYWTIRNDHSSHPYLLPLLKDLNMLPFAGAMMWVLQKVFNMDVDSCICAPNEKLGRKLLSHITKGGNFGHYNMDTIASRNSHFGRFVNQVVNDCQLAYDYPCEALWSPFSMIREFLRIRI